jgi:hypothetical protein
MCLILELLRDGRKRLSGYQAHAALIQDKLDIR